MTSSVSSTNNPANAAHTANAASSSGSGTTSPLAALPAQPSARSYANATKKPFSPPAIASSTPPVAVGNPVQAQHGNVESASPVNGRNSIQPAVPNMAAPAIANGAPAQSDHSRKPSSLTISASGTSGYMPNGGPVGPSSRPNINFGFMNAGGSPAVAHSVPHHPQSSSLATPMSNPRVTSPATSPSPIPQPQASGGRPPSGLHNSGNGLSFGSMSGDSSDHSVRALSFNTSVFLHANLIQVRPTMPQGPSSQPQHLRRESSQSTQSDLSTPGMNMNRGGPPNGGRARGGYGAGFVPPTAHSPASGFRQMSNPRPGGPNVPPQFQNQTPMGHPNSPYRATRSPALPPAALHQQAHLANAPMYGGYPQHLQAQQPVKQPSSSRHHSKLDSTSQHSNSIQSHSGSFLLRHHDVDPTQPLLFPDLSPENGAFERFLTILKTQGPYGMPQGYDPGYAAYFNMQAGVHPNMYYQGAPPSPRPFAHTPHGAQQQYMQGQYGGAPNAQGMSRTSSQVSERPSSTLGQPQTPAMSAVSHVSPTPNPTAASPAPNANFTLPNKSKTKVRIQRPDGQDVTFDKTAPSSAPAPSRSPVVVSSTPTPPPRAPSSTEPLHARSESKSQMTDAEKKAAFQEQVRKQLEAEKAEEKRKADEEEQKIAKEKADAEAQAAKEKEEADAKAAKEKADAEKAEAEAEKARQDAEKAQQDADKAKSDEEEKARLQREEDERLEREIAEMEELERQEEERERAYQEKKKKEAEEKARKEAEAAANADEEMRRAEREAEEAEEARQKAKPAEIESEADKAEKESLFASLKKPTVGPGATVPSESGASTPASDVSMPPPPQPAQPKPFGAGKMKPAALKLETNKQIEPAQPTAGMQALRSARFLQVRNEEINYPESIKSPNPALNQGSKSKGRQYDKDFLLQFQEVFKEKPAVDWDQKIKDLVGDGSESARTPSTRGIMSTRQASRPAMPPSGLAQGPMGNFQGGRTIPPGTTSEQRFAIASNQSRPAPMTNPLASFANRPAGFPMGGPPMARTASFQSMGQAGPPSQRQGSQRGSSRRNKPDSSKSKREEEQAAKTMPLTAGMDLKPLEVSKVGWKPTSIGSGPTGPALPGGHLTPDLVQRKVKAALNKMTPENFDKIAGQILEIAAQSKDETDGRTLRQIIQLTFEKACDEAHWASMYAKFCQRMLTSMSGDIKDETVIDKNGRPVVGGALFRKYLLNRCQEEFERGWEVNLPEKPEGQTEEAAMLSDEYYIAAAAKRRGLGLIQFIGELYKLGMLTLRIMHECVLKLLNFEGMPDESAVESLVKLLRTVGATMENAENGPKMISMYFDRIEKIMAIPGLPSRLHFMLLDIVDLRKRGWRSKDDNKGPKTIQEIHEEAQAAHQAAELERQRTSQRGGGGGGRLPMGRGDARSFSGGGMMPPPDYPRNQIAMDDLRKLSKGASGRNVSQGAGGLGPSFMGPRSSSGRKGLGPGMMQRGEESGGSSRTGTPPVKEKESTSHTNAFR